MLPSIAVIIGLCLIASVVLWINAVRKAVSKIEQAVTDMEESCRNVRSIIEASKSENREEALTKLCEAEALCKQARTEVGSGVRTNRTQIENLLAQCQAKLSTARRLVMPDRLVEED